MLTRVNQEAYSDLARGLLLLIENSDSSQWVKVRIDQFVWYMTKCIYLGTVVDASAPTKLGKRYVGTVKQATEYLMNEGRLQALELTQSEVDYLLQPWDTTNPTTNHEKRVSSEFLTGLGSA